MAGVKSVQYGSMSFVSGNAFADAALSTAVNIAKSTVHQLGQSIQPGSGVSEVARMSLISASTVRAIRTASSFSNVVSFVVLEFN